MLHIAASEQVKLQLYDGPTFALEIEDGASGTRWIWLSKL
jgi:hypothetical protein